MSEPIIFLGYKIYLTKDQKSYYCHAEIHGKYITISKPYLTEVKSELDRLTRRLK
jgi:hypothetical protein